MGNESAITLVPVGKVNGVPVNAQYDGGGNLIGYAGDPNAATAWISDNQRIVGQWDASGKPMPKTMSSGGGGGLFGGLLSGLGDIGQSIIDAATSSPIGAIATAYFAPGVGEAIGAALNIGTTAGTILAQAEIGRAHV